MPPDQVKMNAVAQEPIVLDYAATHGLPRSAVWTDLALMVGIVLGGSFVFILVFDGASDELLQGFMRFGSVLLIAGSILCVICCKRLFSPRRSVMALSSIFLCCMGAISTVGSTLVWTSTTHCSWPHSTPRAPSACRMNLRSIGQALYAYADEEDGSFPDSLYTLVNMNLISPKQFYCPDDASGNISYHYIPGCSIHSDPRRIVLFENLGNHSGGGGHILWQDSHVSFENGHRFKHLIHPFTPLHPKSP